MKKITFFIIFIFLMFFTNKIYAKPIMPPVDKDDQAPYVKELGGYGVFKKYVFNDPNTDGYYVYKMPYSICIFENENTMFFKTGDNVSLSFSDYYQNEYSITHAFATTYYKTFNQAFNLTIGNKTLSLGSSFTHTFGDLIESKIENSIKRSNTYQTTFEKNFIADNDGYYGIYSYTYFDAYIFQKFDINTINGYPQKIAKNEYDIVFTVSDRYASYCEFVYSETNVKKESYISDNVIYITNYYNSIIRCLNEI